MKIRKKRYVLLLFLFLFPAGCSAKEPLIGEHSSQTAGIFAMDTYITITAYGKEAEAALADCESRILELEALLSVTDENSEIYKLNHSEGKPCTVSDDTAEILGFALKMAENTAGALEPTIYPLLTAWGFTTDSYQIPEQSELEALMNDIGYDRVQITGNVVALPEGMEIDLGAVAKGYTADELAGLLKEQGVSSAVISLGGNVQTVGTKPDGTLWRIGVKSPDDSGNFGILELGECAVVTSGSYQKYFVGEDGNTYHHIIDPSTGRPAQSGLLSLTVVSAEGKTCDALSTALFVMGKERAAEYWRENRGFEMILYTEDQKIYITKGLEEAFTIQKEHEAIPVMVIEP